MRSRRFEPPFLPGQQVVNHRNYSEAEIQLQRKSNHGPFEQPVITDAAGYYFVLIV
ncbi:unnamed protein product [Cylicocyclus nassatus]|uniref:Uncharacterized protein n=1 Tax=Cylicocyclus nassatus TaxID=53992 RepID=A0AA36MA48_CYLNA|nr:unnamed protein product [Cylicocyclus nassatus]